MLENEFFPTPEYVVDKMVQPFTLEYRGNYGLDRGRRVILDPSAGKGDILERLVKRFDLRRGELSAIEIDPELRTLLNGKGYRVVDSDFLEYQGNYRFNLILMNPPFSKGVEHLLKAWDILYEGDIVCLLNAESIRNPYSEKRKLVARLIEQFGSVEYIGSAFVQAEFPTDVEIALVRLKKEAPESTVNFDGQFEKERKIDEEAFAASPLAHANIIEALVAQYNAAAAIMVQQSELERKLLFYVKGIKDTTHQESQVTPDINKRLDDLKHDFWQYIFDKTRLGSVTTSDFQKRFYQFTQETERLAFSVRNITEILEMFFLNRLTIMEECLLQVFDQATAFHEDNKVHSEGWKTNKSWKIARKIIVPYGVQFDKKYGTWSTYSSWRRDFFMDVDKVMCFLSGRNFDTVQLVEEIITDHLHNCGNAFRHGTKRYDEYIFSSFFKIRIFKKGTVHLYFEDEALWNQFNVAAAKGKNWLGQGY